MRPFTSLSQGLRAFQNPPPLNHSNHHPRQLHHPLPLTDRTSDAQTDAEKEAQNRERRANEPAYQITFTCKPCGNRSTHRLSKHGYHRGTVLIKCPSCENRHVISDHLNIFFDKKTTLQEILEEKGDKITRGYLDGDMEFWDDGSVTEKKAEGRGRRGDQKQGVIRGSWLRLV
ncbi:zf-DNL-domain-containing protein [Aspergillus heteromorphus CBS 117.55]|uniref:Zf-DNL-domain-containing protein n=1 Tax=Aspergillus heteromorphus CBS 117.55 TaxID=1448321 RepID=A0A317VYY6_9EURO|nr:zf-DNL-domain-containing protein [Aspergillus heteromorphus CBS 117.55]PWY78232.1 zf-DNL-domain-containing protein [Aspergillus heteromorphus CBS 117.55]